MYELSHCLSLFKQRITHRLFRIDSIASWCVCHTTNAVSQGAPIRDVPIGHCFQFGSMLTATMIKRLVPIPNTTAGRRMSGMRSSFAKTEMTVIYGVMTSRATAAAAAAAAVAVAAAVAKNPMICPAELATRSCSNI